MRAEDYKTPRYLGFFLALCLHIECAYEPGHQAGAIRIAEILEKGPPAVDEVRALLRAPIAPPGCPRPPGDIPFFDGFKISRSGKSGNFSGNYLWYFFQILSIVETFRNRLKIYS